MISLTDFEDVAKARFEDSLVLAVFDKYHGAIYLCGFAVEIALKVNISKENNQSSFPETDVEFRDFPIQQIKTHNLVRLRDLSPAINRKLRLDPNCRRMFTLVSNNWDVNYRYKKNIREL